MRRTKGARGATETTIRTCVPHRVSNGQPHCAIAASPQRDHPAENTATHPPVHNATAYITPPTPRTHLARGNVPWRAEGCGCGPVRKVLLSAGGCRSQVLRCWEASYTPPGMIATTKCPLCICRQNIISIDTLGQCICFTPSSILLASISTAHTADERCCICSKCMSRVFLGSACICCGIHCRNASISDRLASSW